MVIPPKKQDAHSFMREAESRTPNVISEFWALLRHNKKWWLTPIIVVLLLVGALVLLLGTSAAPLIYTLF